MPATPIAPFLLPRGLPTARTLRTLQQHQIGLPTRRAAPHQCFSSTSPVSKAKNVDKSRTLAQPDKFRPPSHPQRLVNKRTSPSGQPINYGPRLTPEQREAQNKKQYPNMFPPEGTVMHKFLTNRWIHVWIAMGILTSLATFTFTTNFKASSPFAHLLPSWSGLLTAPFDTISQALHVYRMDVQHNSMRVREQRHRRVEDAEKRRQYRLAHGLEEPTEKGQAKVDEQSPVAVEGDTAQVKEGEYVDWDGKKKPVKKWLGIW
ncbi:hypothetical protein N7532_008462 [Penicillium argentinense]|uniref:Uncharacterized protein n=1 Tax=Penicillium argentinense TaxID=1131581 RepID=A0A9W9EXD4_9EURO|nr:uncharacterized protein N7532_008462 [Penicillium argentinense]KAJ5089778.1 hypothetical protein N7532_008462 [Penicillium argentinense]